MNRQRPTRHVWDVFKEEVINIPHEYIMFGRRLVVTWHSMTIKTTNTRLMAVIYRTGRGINTSESSNAGLLIIILSQPALRCANKTRNFLSLSLF